MIDPQDPPDEVKKWIARLKRTMKAMPAGLWLFNTGTMHIMAEGETGPIMTGYQGGYDPAYEVDTIPDLLSEGGDW